MFTTSTGACEAMPSPTGPERLRELSRQINLAQRCRAAAASAPTEVEGAISETRHCTAPERLESELGSSLGFRVQGSRLELFLETPKPLN